MHNNKIIKFLIKELNNDCVDYSKEDVVKMLSTTENIIVNFNNNILGVALIYDKVKFAPMYSEFNHKIVYIYGTLNQFILSEIDNLYKDEVVIIDISDYTLDISQLLLKNNYSLQRLNFINKDYAATGYIYINKDSNYLMTNYLDKIYYDNVNIDKVSYKMMSYSELKKNVYNNDTAEYNLLRSNEGFCPEFLGFHYFSPGHIQKHVKYETNVVALYKDTIIGIIAIKAYEKGNRDYNFVNYIDVRKDCKKKGIATGMVKHLAANYSDILIGSEMSKEGQMVKINEIFKTYIQKWYDTEKDFKLNK